MTRSVRILGQVPRARWLTAAVVVLLAASLALGACLGSSDRAERQAARARASTTSTVPPEVRVVAASVAVESMRPEPVEFPNDVKDAVVAVLNAWVDAGIVNPVLTGQPPVGLDAAFTPAAVARLASAPADRAAVLEDVAAGGLGAGGIEPERASASLVGLANGGGGVELVTASVDVSIVVVTGTGRVRVARTGEVVLMGVPGGWRIDSYDVVARRDTVAPAAATTTTEGEAK